MFRTWVVILSILIAILSASSSADTELKQVDGDLKDIDKLVEERDLEPIPLPPPTHPLKVIKRMTPVYPRAALRKGLQGRVRAQATVDQDGNVRTVQILFSDPMGTFDESVTRAMEENLYEPHTYDRVLVEQDYYFRLSRRQPEKPH